MNQVESARLPSTCHIDIPSRTLPPSSSPPEAHPWNLLLLVPFRYMFLSLSGSWMMLRRHHFSWRAQGSHGQVLATIRPVLFLHDHGSVCLSVCAQSLISRIEHVCLGMDPP